MSCDNYPSKKDVEDFALNAKVINEFTTESGELTTSAASDGKNKITLAEIWRQANEKSITEAFLYENAEIIFDSVADLKLSASLSIGHAVKTLGYYEKSDGGGASYIIESGTADGFGDHQIRSGVIAKLQHNYELNFRQFGAKNSYEFTESSGENWVAIIKYAESLMRYYYVPDNPGLYVGEPVFPVIKIPLGSYLIDKTVDLVRNVFKFECHGAVFNTTVPLFGGVGLWRGMWSGGIFKQSNVGENECIFPIKNDNVAAGNFIVNNVTFDNCVGWCIDLDCQSTEVTTNNVLFLACHKFLRNRRCDFLTMNGGGGLGSPRVDAESHEYIDNYGKITINNLNFNPPKPSAASMNYALCANRYDDELYMSGGRTGVLICNQVRFGGEAGGISAVNNYAGQITTPVTRTAPTAVILNNCDMYAADSTEGVKECHIRLYAVPNQLRVVGGQSMVGVKLIDFPTAEIPELSNAIDIYVHNQVSDTAISSLNEYMNYVPGELIRYANLRHFVRTMTANGSINESLCRGATLISSDVKDSFVVLPPAKVGMQVTVSGAGGFGIIAQTSTDQIIDTTSGEVARDIQAQGIITPREISATSLSSIKTNTNQLRQLKCFVDGVWLAS